MRGRPAAALMIMVVGDYAGDTRSNAEINSIGEQAGTCPKPRPYRADTSCTNRINSAGERTGSCPLPQK